MMTELPLFRLSSCRSKAENVLDLLFVNLFDDGLAPYDVRCKLVKLRSTLFDIK